MYGYVTYLTRVYCWVDALCVLTSDGSKPNHTESCLQQTPVRVALGKQSGRALPQSGSIRLVFPNLILNLKYKRNN